MGICASSTPMGSNNSKKGAADPVVKKVIRKSGASKYGPYRCVEVAGEKKWTNSLRQDAPSFDTEGDLKKWLLDYISVNDKTDETIVREPGTLAGTQFIVNNCKNCNFWLLDYTSTITIDKCEDCRFFIGPCESSLFIRDSKNCKAVMAVGQLRTRDCHNMDILLYSQTEPVIEKSTGIKFGCFRSSYFNLKKQMEMCGLHPFQNRWFDVHDFTPDTGNNWSKIRSDAFPVDLLNELPQTVGDVASFSGYENVATGEQGSDVAGAEATTVPSAIPYTHGDDIALASVTTEETLKHGFVYVFPHEQSVDAASEVVDVVIRENNALSESNVQLVRTKAFQMEKWMAEKFFEDKATVEKSMSGDSIGMHFYGENCDKVVKIIESELGARNENVLFFPGDAKERSSMYFDEFKISEST